MIFTEFAPNETRVDSLHSLSLLVRPWLWKKGKEQAKFKLRVRKRFFHDTSEVFLFLTGRCALYHALKALDLPEHSEVLVQGFTCGGVILPVLTLNLKPVYVDIHKDDFSMNLKDLTKKISPQSKVLILQHSFGISPGDRDEIIKLCKTHKIHIIEDLAHGFHNDIFKTKPLQSTVLLSFGKSKSLSTVFGGAIVTKNKKITQYLSKVEKKISSPSFMFMFKEIVYKVMTPYIKALYKFHIGKIIHVGLKSLNFIIPEITAREKKGEFDLQFAKGFPNLNALFGMKQLIRYNDVSRRKEQITEFYNATFKKDYKGSLLRYPILVDNPQSLYKKALKKGIYLGLWYTQPIAPKSINLDYMLYQSKSCPQAESITKHIINLPTCISKEEAKMIVDLITKT